MATSKKTLRKELEDNWTNAQEKEYQKQKRSEYDATERGQKLMEDVAKSSSESARIWQTLGHLGGKGAGDASDAAIRAVENYKESRAEDEFRNAELARVRRRAVSEPLLIDAPPSKKKK